MNNQTSFNPADQSSTVWGAMFARPGNAADRLRDMAQQAIDQYNAELSGGGEPTYPAWAQDVFDVLAASRAMLPVTDSQQPIGYARIKDLAELADERVAGYGMMIHKTGSEGKVPLFASPVAGWVSVEKDAARWRALLASARLRPLGSAGLKTPEPNNYAHLGLELWTVFGRNYSPELLARLDSDNEVARRWLEQYADIAHAAQTTPPAPVTPKQEQSNG